MFDVNVTTTKHRTDCGATCLKMMFDYYNVETDMEDLIAECNVSIAGCTMADIKKVGEKYGLNMIAYSMEAEELFMQDRPSIIWWTYNHFVMFCGVDDYGNVVIIDPDCGRMRLNSADFANLYAGVACFNGEPETVTMNTVQDIAELAYINAEYNSVLIDMIGGI